MKISKITTASFAISAEIEKLIEKEAAKDKNTKIAKGYLPLAKFHVVRSEQAKKGVLFKKTSFDKRENNFYLDMAYGDIYYLHTMGVFDKRPQMMRNDFFVRIMNLRQEAINLLGELHEYGSLPLEDVDRNIALNLVREGFAFIYEPDANQVFNFLREAIDPDDIITRKYFLKGLSPLPNFGNSRYNLHQFLEMSDEVNDAYEKEGIKFSHETLGKLLEDIYWGQATLTSIVYLPFIAISEIKENKETINIRYPIAAIHDPAAQKTYKKGEKLKPISFATSMDAFGSVPLEASTINFADVADMEEVKEQIRQKIVYPLTKPELAKEYGKTAGGSVLFYGPPGCGKTYIARATVGECGINFFNINTSDIISGGAEAGAKNIHNVFMRASQNSPAIVFFDELDALGGRRDMSQGETDRVVVNQFLMEMDGAESMSTDVLIIGSTNMPWELDPALRRAGRFTNQIFIPPPEVEARAELFRIHTRKKQVAKDLDFAKLADLTEDYSSADVAAVCDDTIEMVWKEALETGKPRLANLEDFLKTLNNRKSTLTPWYKLAEKQIKQSGEASLFEQMAQFILRHAGGVDQAVVPELSFKDVGDLEEVKEVVRKRIVYPLAHPELSQKYGRGVGGGVLLYGPPGCGKTYLAKATAGECKSSFFNIKVTDIISSEPGQTEKNLADIFQRASHNTPCILFFDEIDAIASRRSGNMAGSEKRLVNQMLSELDGFEKKEGVVVMGSTNAPWDIDPALRRSGRFTDQVYVPSPDMKTRVEVFKVHIRNKPIVAGLDVEKLAEMTEGYSSADIKTICDYALEVPWEESVHGGESRDADIDDFIKVIRERKTSLAPWFKLAQDQVTKAGEQDIYKELWSAIQAFQDSASGISDEIKHERRERERQKDLVTQLEKERKQLQNSMELTRNKFLRREIDSEVFRQLMNNYQEKLIESEVKLNDLRTQLDGTKEKKKKHNKT